MRRAGRRAWHAERYVLTIPPRWSFFWCRVSRRGGCRGGRSQGSPGEEDAVDRVDDAVGCAIDNLGSSQLLADHVVEQDRAELLALLKRVELVLRDPGEGSVGRRDRAAAILMPSS
jgi:hypothetical protein